MEPEQLDPLELSRDVACLVHCYNALLGVQEARTRLACLATQTSEGMAASLELTHGAMAVQVGALAKRLGLQMSFIERVAAGQAGVQHTLSVVG